MTLTNQTNQTNQTDEMNRKTPPRWNDKTRQTPHRWSKKKRSQDGPLSSAPPDRDPEEWAETRRNALWQSVAAPLREQLQLDSVSLYSVTEDSIADRMTTILANWINPDCTITDGTACVGGNTISFARKFTHVNAVELTHSRCDMLRHNAGILGVGEKISVHEGDYIDLCRSLKQDVVFLDPPWGGPDYKRARKLDLYLGSINIAKLTFNLLTWNAGEFGVPRRPATKLVALKLPYNYNYEALEAAAREVGLNPADCIYKMIIGKIHFVIVCLPFYPKPRLPPGIMCSLSH